MSDEMNNGEAGDDNTANVAPEQVLDDATSPDAEIAPEAELDPVAKLEAENAELRDQLLRTMADMENTRKRAQRQISEASIYAIEKFAGDLLSVSDNLGRALESLSEEDKASLSEGGKGLFSGIEMTQKDLHTALARHGVTAIAAEPGDVFDPNLHQAVANIPSEHANGAIASCFQPGWKIGERTLRAAMVAVSAG
ncbi:MAG: nucleotide exchange factor GrpE [Hyphomonas sp.]